MIVMKTKKGYFGVIFSDIINIFYLYKAIVLHFYNLRNKFKIVNKILIYTRQVNIFAQNKKAYFC